jgi:RimJ/RimL family protein N-acetyltransferase
MTLWGSTHTPVGLAQLRELDSGDIDAIVQFWHHSGDEFLDFLGIDRSRLGTVHDTRQRFLRAIPTGSPDQKSIAFAITVAGQFSGYTLLNRYTPEINYSHWHITNPDLRGCGLSTALYPHRIKTYFDSVRMNRLIHQTRTRNVGVNRMLDRYVSVAETVYRADPDGVALPGEFHLRYVLPADIADFFARAAAGDRGTR